MPDDNMVQLAINTIRTLSMDAVQAAKSGHPGTPMALAPLVYTIWNRVLRFDPQDPIWPNRDRFVLSNGHASMLLWSILHLTGVQAVNADYEKIGEPAVAGRHPPVSPTGQQGPRPSRIPLGVGC
jgi:transketolase